MRIRAQEATIKTASVEVKMLTISGRKVTLGLFRQLQNEYLIDPDTGLLLGVPWGKVNYYFDNCRPDHLHIVWQKEDELRRACVYPYPRYGNTWRWDGFFTETPLPDLDEQLRDACRNYLTARYVNGNNVKFDTVNYASAFTTIGVGPTNRSIRVSFEGKLPELLNWRPYEPSPFHLYTWDDPTKEAELRTKHEESAARNVAERDQKREDLIVGINAELKNYGSTEAGYYATEINKIDKAMRDFVDRWHESYIEIDQLDQLFIAG